MTESAQPIAIFGGTFDPLHIGHISLSSRACKWLGVTKLSLIPCHIPPHKGTPSVSAEHRVNMLAGLANENPFFSVDTREINKHAPSYTVETLREIRHEVGNSIPILLLIGGDSIAQFHTWYCWQEILTLCHVIVLPRFQDTHEPITEQNIIQAITTDVTQIQSLPAGKICFAPLSKVTISSTQIRDMRANGLDAKSYLPPAIFNYIEKHQLYPNLTVSD